MKFGSTILRTILLLQSFHKFGQPMLKSEEDGECKIVDFTFTAHSFSFVKHKMTERKLNKMITAIVAPIQIKSVVCSRYIKDFIEMYSLPQCEAIDESNHLFDVKYLCKKTCNDVIRDSCFRYVRSLRESSKLLNRMIDCQMLPETDCNSMKPRKESLNSILTENCSPRFAKNKEIPVNISAKTIYNRRFQDGKIRRYFKKYLGANHKDVRCFFTVPESKINDVIKRFDARSIIQLRNVRLRDLDQIKIPGACINKRNNNVAIPLGFLLELKVGDRLTLRYVYLALVKVKSKLFIAARGTMNLCNAPSIKESNALVFAEDAKTTVLQVFNQAVFKTSWIHHFLKVEKPFNSIYLREVIRKNFNFLLSLKLNKPYWQLVLQDPHEAEIAKVDDSNSTFDVTISGDEHTGERDRQFRLSCEHTELLTITPSFAAIYVKTKMTITEFLNIFLKVNSYLSSHPHFKIFSSTSTEILLMKGEAKSIHINNKLIKHSSIQRMMNSYSRNEGIIAVVHGNILEHESKPKWLRVGPCKMVFKSTDTEIFMLELHLDEYPTLKQCMPKKSVGWKDFTKLLRKIKSNAGDFKTTNLESCRSRKNCTTNHVHEFCKPHYNRIVDIKMKMNLLNVDFKVNLSITSIEGRSRKIHYAKNVDIISWFTDI